MYFKLLLIYLTAINIAGFTSMGFDKNRARRHMRRVSEKSLFLFALFGGSLGSLIGMYAFRHKTKHLRFEIGIPLILLCQIALAVWIIKKMGFF